MLRSLCFCLLFALSASSLAEEAATPKNLTPIEEPRATVDDKIKPGSERTTRQEKDAHIEEFRLRGRVYMIKVYPLIGQPYTLVDERGDGSFNRLDSRRLPSKPAQWQVLSW